jgi:tetratricopeptide (TPR) repeat protein
MALADEASNSARRGDYALAMKQLDEAERIAPKFVTLYQFRSNVAYLMGDKKAAIAALQKGLRLEPDNALFRENLKRLQQPQSR